MKQSNIFSTNSSYVIGLKINKCVDLVPLFSAVQLIPAIIYFTCTFFPKKFNFLYYYYLKDGDQSALDGVTLTIEPRQKIGVVGRTGAGKSSLVAALFRLGKICEGRVLIDGVDTRELSLRQLRASVAIIPQQPVLFSGTLRNNLDPFGQFADAVLWTALEEVDLKEAVADLPGGLGARMHEGGANFSVGQRQLVRILAIFKILKTNLDTKNSFTLYFN